MCCVLISQCGCLPLLRVSTWATIHSRNSRRPSKTAAATELACAMLCWLGMARTSLRKSMAPLVASFSRAFFRVCSQMPRTVCGAVVKATIRESAAAAAFSCQAADGMSAAEPALAFRRACDSCLQQAALVRSLLPNSGS